MIDNKSAAMIRTKLLSFFLLLFFLAPLQAQAHNLWLNATDFSPELSGRAGAHSKIYFGFGHKFPVADFLDRDKLREFRLIQPDQSSSDLQAGDGGFLATPIIMKKAGPYIVSAATNTGFYTMFNQNGRIHHKMGSMEGLDNVVLSLYYENYTKALLNVGTTATDAFSTPVGHGIEIVPLENPYLKKAGDTLKLQILHNGKPVPFCPVSATYVGFSDREDYAFSNKTNSQGISTIRLLQPGQWIVLASVRTPAGEELKGKCLEMKYTASLSFAVQ
jgi:uncharacterized GH25 family protein